MTARALRTRKMQTTIWDEEKREQVRCETYIRPVGIETNYDETLVAGLAAAEKQVQQSYRPIIGVHKWFARRPGTLFRGLALSEADSRPLANHYFDAHDLDGVVLDPFMGGGTTLFEGNRIGLAVVGYDTNPMSRWLVERELEELDVDLFEKIGEEIAGRVEAAIGDLYRTKCEECNKEAEVKSFLWVKTHVCSKGHETLLFPGPLVAGRRMDRHTHDVLVCGSCRKVNQFLPGASPDDCPDCGVAYADTKIPAKAECKCGEEFQVGKPSASSPPKHTLFAIEYHCADCKKKEGRRGRFFKGADKKDHARFNKACKLFNATSSPYWPVDTIPAGDETNRLLRWGYKKFRDLHNERQLLGLATLAEEISKAPAEVRPALATVYSDFIRYQNMVCRYDTAALKVLDVFSVHGFPVHRVQCEAALIGQPRIGSGGFRHFLAKYAAAKRYCEEPFETTRVGGKKKKVPVVGERIAAKMIDDESQLSEDRAALLRCASISAEPLQDESVDMVLTDPPYFANVQYSELMDFLFSWLRRLMPDTAHFSNLASSRSKDEVTGNVTGGVGINEFAEGMSGVYTAATNALKPGSPFAFTYHHNDLSSYAAITVAVLDAGLIPVCTFACPSEMRGSIHINSSDSSRVDTVFVFRKAPVADTTDESVPVPDRLDAHIKNLEAAGLEVSNGDRRCISHGLIAEEAMRSLADTWDRDADIADKMTQAGQALEEHRAVLEDDGELAAA